MAPRADRECLMAIDVGTSGARAAVLDLGGRTLLEVRRPYPTLLPRPGWAEQDARRWRSAALGALGQAMRTLGPGRRVMAIGLTGQCPSVVGVDARGEPVGPGLIYRDNRATAEAAEMRRRFGAAALHARTGHLAAAFHVGPKILWLRRHRRDEFRRTARFLQPRDLVLTALTGDEATDGTHAAATLLFDLRARRWDHDIMASLGLDPSLLPPVRGSWEAIGELRPALRRHLGLAYPVPVILGGADSQACALGAGVVEAGPVSEMAGSSTCLNAVVPAPLDVLEITHYTHVLPDGFTTETGLNTTGAAVRWLARLLYGDRAGGLGAADYERLDRETAEVAAGADGLLALPVLGDGERTDPLLRGAFTGLSERHGRAELLRAMLEGVAYAIRAQLELLRGGGAPVDELRVSGGDVRLTTWNQIKADVTGIPVAPVAGDAAVVGVALLGGLGAGVYRDVPEALARGVRLGPRVEPRAAARHVHDERYPAWARLWAAAVARRRASGP